MERETALPLLTQQGLLIQHDVFTFSAGGLRAAIAEYRISQFEFRDSDGTVDRCKCILRGMKHLLGAALQRTIEDKSSIYRRWLDYPTPASPWSSRLSTELCRWRTPVRLFWRLSKKTHLLLPLPKANAKTALNTMAA